MTIDPHDIHRLDQAAPDALMAVDALAADPETSRRLEAKGEATYGYELTRDLALACGYQPLSLAGWAAFATIRLVQAHSDLERVTAERDGLVETIGRLVSLPPEQIATMHKVGYNDTSAHGLGSTSTTP